LKSIDMKKSERCCCSTEQNDTSLVLLFVRQLKAVTDSSAPSVNDDDGYGYNETVSAIRQLTAVESEV